jgi:hypothetical protein
LQNVSHQASSFELEAAKLSWKINQREVDFRTFLIHANAGRGVLQPDIQPRVPEMSIEHSDWAAMC